MRRPSSLLLIAAALVATGGGATWRAVSVREAMFDRVARRMVRNTAGTAAAVERWIEERRYDAATIAGEAAELTARGAGPDDAATRAAVGHLLRRVRGGHGYANAWAFDSAGRLLASAAPGAPSAAERSAAEATLTSGRAQLCGPFAVDGGQVAVCYAVSASHAGGLEEQAPRASLPLIAIVMRSDPYGSLVPLVESADTGDDSERSRLLAQVGDSVAMLSLSHRQGAHARSAADGGMFAHLSELPAPVLVALGGTTSTGRIRTFGGRDVLVGARRIRGSQWAVIRMVDVAEIDLVYWQQMRTEGLLLLAMLAAGVLAAASAMRTERTRRMREVAASEARLADTLRSSFDAVIAFDDDERITFFNAAAERMFGTPASAMLGAHVSVIGTPAMRDAQLARFRAFMSGEETALALPAASPMSVARRGSGEEFRVEAVLSKGAAGGRRLHTLIVRDVTERQRADAALRASEASARAFVERSPYGICRLTRDGQFTSVNPALVAMLGYPDAASLLAASIDTVWPERARRAELSQRHAAGEATLSGIEATWRRADGRPLAVRLSTRAVADDAGTLIYYEGFIENLAPLRAAEQALRQAEKLAAVGQFVSGVAHELNNPLTAILLFAEHLIDETADAEERETLLLVRDQARRARAIVRDLLAFVRNAHGETVTVPARELLDGVVHALRRQVGRDGARVTLVAPEELGWLHVDRAGIEQVVTNLVLNAVHAAPGGEVRVVVAAQPACASDAAPRRRLLRVAVEDEGPGIPAEVLPRMFEPFFTTKPVGVGTGLGLSVSLGIAERHGGTLVAENRGAAGPGARVVLTLPLVDPPADVAVPAAAAVGDDVDARGSVARRVLIVDDEPPVRHALARYFTRRQWTVDEAEDGQAALDCVLATPDAYDLVISDLRMPGVSGIALHDRLAAVRPELLDRFIISTGDVVSPEAAEFVARTRCAVLEKPFEFGALDALVRRVLARLGAPTP